MDLQEAFDAGFDAVKTYVDRSFEVFEARLAAVEARQPEKGEPGRDGKDGVSISDESVDAAVLRAVEDAIKAIPLPENGKDGKDGAPGRDGKDGVSLAGAVIDRSGVLVLTLSDGSTRDMGEVVGKNGENGINGKDGAPGAAGKDGADGLGFDDLSVEHDGERGFAFCFARGGIKKEFAISVPVVIDRGVWREGQYQKGDGATWAGSFFIAQRDTTDKPETSDAWRLAVKRGRDGKDGKPGDQGKEGPQGRAGRDLTQVGPDGAKW